MTHFELYSHLADFVIILICLFKKMYSIQHFLKTLGEAARIYKEYLPFRSEATA